jgi:hypothetical protein
MPSTVTLTYDFPASDQTHLEGTYLTDDNLSGTFITPIIRNADSSFAENETAERMRETILLGLS